LETQLIRVNIASIWTTNPRALCTIHLRRKWFTHTDQVNDARTHSKTMARPDANEQEAIRADKVSILNHQRALNQAFQYH